MFVCVCSCLWRPAGKDMEFLNCVPRFGGAGQSPEIGMRPAVQPGRSHGSEVASPVMNGDVQQS